jgi:sugar/nucleoside kinase (ribokinase family)
MLDCLSAGILVVDHLTSPVARVPRAGELVMADELSLSIGGNAANVSMNLARLGVKVGVAGCVGDDVFGECVCCRASPQRPR